MPLENWIQHSRVNQFLYDWQTVIAGVFALVAAGLAVRAARQRERREVEAIRLSLAVEIRRLVDILCQTHHGFGEHLSQNLCPRADDVVKQTSRGVPVVYPATADRVYLVDPLGNVMMVYPPDGRPKGMLEDLKRLLGLSHVG